MRNKPTRLIPGPLAPELADLGADPVACAPPVAATAQQSTPAVTAAHLRLATEWRRANGAPVLGDA